MEEVRRTEEMSLVELEAQSAELLPDREEMVIRRSFNRNESLAAAINGSAAASNAGALQVFIVAD